MVFYPRTRYTEYSMNDSESIPSDPAQESLAIALPSWLSLRRVPRPILLGVSAAALLALIGVVATLPFLLDLSESDLEALGYPGLFIANFLGTATVFVPVPGLTAAGQALIVVMAERFNPVTAALVGSAGMTLAESTAYLAGYVGREIGEEHEPPLKGQLGQWLRHGARLIDRLMGRYGFLTLLVLSAVPNPLFEFAGITAGAVQMKFWRFLLAVAIGKTTRALLLAFLGKQVLDLFNF